jgi:hypothetical protein
VAFVTCALLVAGCGSHSEPKVHELAQGKWGTGEVLTDVGAMVERVPALATATTVSYAGGSQVEPDGDRAVTVPGPTDSWIDAVVTFPGGDDIPALECGETGATATSAGDIQVADVLADALGEGQWTVCAPGAFAAQGWDVTAFLDADANIVVLQMTSQ